MANKTQKTDVWVYAHWQGMPDPKWIGILSSQQAKGKTTFSFAYNPAWLNSTEQILHDTDISWYKGPQFPGNKTNFGVFLDSMPDRWGRTLLKRRAAQLAQKSGHPPEVLYDIDFLLGVYDESRMGALRFKLDPEGPFLDDEAGWSIPPWSSARNLQHAANKIETAQALDELEEWLAMLIAPGSSLGGARPKANVSDEKGHPWIAKFPSANDDIDKGAWEYLAYRLALEAGIDMAPSKLEKLSGSHHTFFTKRFDRHLGERIHFASAMTMTGRDEEALRGETPSYLEIAEFIHFSCIEVKENLRKLWTRIAFNIAVSNTDDHLRNHGFLLSRQGWVLAPAYDINPSVDKKGLALNIDADDNSLDFELVKSIGDYFQLGSGEMAEILSQIKRATKRWPIIAKEVGIPRIEQELMERAFIPLPD